MCRPTVCLILIIATFLAQGTDVRVLSTTAYPPPTSTGCDTHGGPQQQRCLPMTTNPATKLANYNYWRPYPPTNVVIPLPTTTSGSPLPTFINHDNHHGGPLRRQTPMTFTTNTPTTSSTYDFWWPFPPANAPPTQTTPPGTIAPILISIISDATSPGLNTSSVAPSTSGSTPLPSSSSSLSSSSSYSTSSALPSSSANAVTAVTFRPIDLVPAFAVVGVFVTGLALWFFYGYCTRKPRRRTDEDELLCGPRYVGIDGTPRRDVEEQGRTDETLHIPRYGRGRGPSGQFRAFRWPSFSEPPAFDPTTGFHVPDEYKRDEDDPLTSVSLFAPGLNDRNRSGSTTVPSRGTFSRQSSAAATSVALLDLYESDDEEVAKRREKELPWESLRHKSIKRNIIEKVKKENKWLDSIRNTFAAPTRPSIRDAGIFSSIDEEVPTVGSVPVSTMVEASSSPVGRRRGHVRADSDIFVDDSLGTTAPLRVRNPSLKPAQQSQESADVPISGVRRTFAKLKDEDERDRYSPLPGRLNENRSRSRGHGRSRSRSQSASPIKQMASLPMAPRNNPPGLVPIRRDFLPQSPSQLMSPPLESQMCFTPIPPFQAPAMSMKVQTPRPARPRSHSRTSSSSPTKIPGPSGGKKLRSYSPPLPPAESITSPFPERTRGRLVKKSNASPAGAKSKTRRTPAADRSREGRARGSATAEGDEAMKKVDQIMAAGWSTRDVRHAEMMSPSGFGSHV